MPSSAADIPEVVRAAGGAVRFDVYLELALYGEHGFYTRHGQAGRRGDFLTSPEVGPLFGAVLARWIDAEFERQGRPDGFTVVEHGAGPGTLARSILLAAPHWRDRYVAVEISAPQRALHPDGVVSVASHVAPTVGVVIANELLDNLPFRLAVYDGGWREAHVGVDRSGALVEVLAPVPSEWDWLPKSAPHGARVPVQQQAVEWVERQRSSVAGTVLAIDYCAPTTASLAARPWREWLRTYAGHERGAHYLRNAGEQDITTEVAVDQLPEPSVVRTQAQFLARWGLDELVEEGRRTWEEHAAAPSLAALRGRSRIREAEALSDPAGLGNFLALEWTV